MTTVIDNALAGKRVLVTGATGFVGAHLARRLAQDEQAIVTGCGRKLDAAPFLRDAGVTLVQADLLDRAAMAELVAGQEVIFHVAAWLGARSGDEAQARLVNADAARMMVELAAAAGVRRVVQVSSIAAYGPPTQVMMDESVPVDPIQTDLYGRSKALGEMEAQVTADGLGVELAIVRPGMIYGPRSYSWTVEMLKLVQRGVPTLFGRADGHAFPVYIDNLCDLLIVCGVHPQAAGEMFNAVDAPVMWKHFFAYYGQMAGRAPRRIPLLLARLVVVASQVMKLRVRLNAERLKFYNTKTVYPIAKAARLLGYTPRVSVHDGMRQTADWLRAQGMIA